MRITVLGAGVVGLAVADELLRRGHAVQVVDPTPGSGASHAAAGMLSPSAEVWHGEDDVLRLGLASLELWPALAARLGVPLGANGTLLVGCDAGDLQQVERQLTLLAGRGHAVDLLDRRAVAALDPSIGRVAGGALLADDRSVDPRAVVRALLARVPVVPAAPAVADVTVIATGSRLPAPYTSLVRGVRGEVLRLRSADPPTRTVRGWVRGEPAYVVPRPGAGAVEVVVGATSEEHDDPPIVTGGGVLRLLAAARELWPALDRAELVEATARDRPGTPDNLPLIGPTGDDGVVLAAGLYRHGVLLAPLTARLVADHLETGAVDPAVDPRRFTTAPQPVRGAP